MRIEIIDAHDIPLMGIIPSLEQVEESYILRVLEFAGQNKTKAAKILGLSLKTVHNRLNQISMRRESTAERTVAVKQTKAEPKTKAERRELLMIHADCTHERGFCVLDHPA